MFCRLLNVCYVYFATLLCAREIDADDENRLNQQNVVLFSLSGIIRE